MKCPKCPGDLAKGERNGIEIDYCVQCRGIWLDGGELDKILERSGLQKDPPNNQPLSSLDDDRSESWWEQIIDIFY